MHTDKGTDRRTDRRIHTCLMHIHTYIHLFNMSSVPAYLEFVPVFCIFVYKFVICNVFKV